MNHTTFFSRWIAPLKYLSPAWFVLVMGWCGLAQTWLLARGVFGDIALGIALVTGAFALLLFVLLCVACVVRLQVHPLAVQADVLHPVRHAFMGALPVSLLLLASLGQGLFWDTSSLANTVLRMIWMSGSVLELAATLWVLSRWLQPAEQGGLQWKNFTPVLFIPVLGNVLAPVAGVPMGMGAWASAQLGIGALLWLVLQTLFFVRLAQAGPLPGRMSASVFICIVPPSLVGLSLMQLNAPDSVIWALWGMAAFFLALALTQLRTVLEQPFGLPLWGVSFPLAALTVLTLDVLRDSGSAWLQIPATLLCAATSFVVVGLTINTWHALRNGVLLVPEG